MQSLVCARYLGPHSALRLMNNVQSQLIWWADTGMSEDTCPGHIGLSAMQIFKQLVGRSHRDSNILRSYAESFCLTR
jgi:hypothetical protein